MSPAHPHRATSRRGSRALVAVIATALAGAPLAGCAADEPVASPAPTRSVSPAPTAEPPALVPDGTADDNLPFFRAVAERVWASDQRDQGRAYVDALAEAGFDKQAMQVTEDLSTVGNPAESMQFSVRWGGECLVGQVGPDIGELVTRVLPAVQDGSLCLLGATRPIDW